MIAPEVHVVSGSRLASVLRLGQQRECRAPEVDAAAVESRAPPFVGEQQAGEVLLQRRRGLDPLQVAEAVARRVVTGSGDPDSIGDDLVGSLQGAGRQTRALQLAGGEDEAAEAPSA